VTETSKDQQKQRRTRRLSAALRDNLKRRKAQARGRTAAQGGEQDRGEQDQAGKSKEPHDSAGFAGDKRSR
jgi:hypothetical protein